MPDHTGRDASDSDIKLYTDSSLAAFLWVPVVSTIWVTCCKYFMGALAGMS